MRTEYRSPSPNISLILLLFAFSVSTIRISLILRNGGSSVNYVTSTICLPKRCSAMDVRSGSTIPAFSRHVTITSSSSFTYYRSIYYHASRTVNHNIFMLPVWLTCCDMYNGVFRGIWFYVTTKH
jgi:hypothetical protein